MAEMVTLEISEQLTNRAREIAQHTGRSFESVLAEWLEWGAFSQEPAHLVADAEYPIFTPYGNEAAAQTLLEALKRTKGDEG